MKLLLHLITIATLIAVPAWAQTRLFLRIGEIPGESLVRGHEGEIELSSWSWGVTNPGAKANWTGLNVSGYMDKAYPRLMAYGTQGRSISNAVLKIAVGPALQEYYRLTLESARITSVTSRGDSGGERAVQQAQIAFSKMTVDYTVFGPDGKASEVVNANWNVLSNTGGSGGTASFNATLTYTAGSQTGQLQWAAVPGKTYEVLLATLPEGPFSLLGSYSSGTNTQMTVSFPFDAPKAFFRIRQL